jgi:hypothetical protein
MGRAMRTTRCAQWQRVGRRASGAGLAWHIWQEQNVPCGNGRIMWRDPVRRTWRSFCAISLFQNRTSEPKHGTCRNTVHGARSWMGLFRVRTESPVVAHDLIRIPVVARSPPRTPGRGARERSRWRGGARRRSRRSAPGSGRLRVIECWAVGVDVTLSLLCASHLLGMLSLSNSQPRAWPRELAPCERRLAEFSIKLYARNSVDERRARTLFIRVPVSRLTLKREADTRV